MRDKRPRRKPYIPAAERRRRRALLLEATRIARLESQRDAAARERSRIRAQGCRECGGKHYATGLCNAHYQRARRAACAAADLDKAYARMGVRWIPA